jgi:hypothetical protein
MADFLIALAEFDRRRGWEPLGHPHLFAFLVAELQPRPEPPLRDLMTSDARVVGPTGPTDPALSLRLESPFPAGSPQAASFTAAAFPAESLPAEPATWPSDTNPDSRSILTSEFRPTQPMRVAPRPDEIEPLTATLTRLHFTVRREVVKKVEAARRGLGHAIPNATLEQVLEAGLDLLLEKQARARGMVKRAVWARDAGRCCWPLDSGGTCGSTHRLELDHIVPWAYGGGETEANLRVVCAAHNRLAARQAFGERVMARYGKIAPRDRLDPHPAT